MPPELVPQLTQRLESGQPDEFGEIGLHVFIGTDQTWCHTQAPSVDAVCKSHQANGIHLDPQDVAEVQVLPQCPGREDRHNAVPAVWAERPAGLGAVPRHHELR
jgi:hypothetical protein